MATLGDKLKILYLSADTFPPFRVDISVLFGREIAGRGHRIDWLLQGGNSSRQAYSTQWLGSKAFVGPRDNGTSLASRIRKNLYGIIHDCKLFELLRAGGYDVILVRDKFITPLMAILASRLYGVKYVYWLSYPFPEDFLYQARNRLKRFPLLYFIRGHVLRFLLYRIIIPLSSHTFVQSEKMLTDVEAQGIDRRKMTPVPMGVSIEEVPFFGYGADQDDSGKTILYLGTLSRVRKLDFLLRVFKKVLGKEGKAKLLLVGRGDVPSDETFLKDQAKSLGIEESVIFTGFLPQKEAWEHVRRADVCISPFYPTPILNSTSPTKLIEYMAMGKATVANDHPDQTLVLSESHAGLCVPWEEEAFAAAILSLLNDRELRKKMGLLGRDYVDNHRNYKHLSRMVEEKLIEIRGK